MARSRRSGGGNLALWILAATLVVIPVLQLSSGQLTSPFWTALTFTVLAIGVVLLGVIPWASGRWARQFLRAERLRDPDAFGSVVMLWDDSTPKELAVVVADTNGLRFLGRSDLIRELPWRQVATLTSAVSQTVGDHVISVADAGGVVLARFVPLKPGGLYPPSVWKIDELCRKFNEVRRRSRVD